MKKLILLNAIFATITLSGCADDARVASSNLSKAADNFEINRRVIFYNGITDAYILTIEGLCSLDASGYPKIAVTCKTGPSTYKKHYLGVSDNVTYFIEQLDAAQASVYHYRVTFKPSIIIPDVQMR
jgi:hypothetical protein